LRILLFTGKGGVGKTTISVATGAYLASLGKKVIVISVDPAHSLSDALDTEVPPEPIEIAKNFYAQEVDVYYSVERFWGKLREYLKSLLRWQKIDEIKAEELSILPGMEEISCFLWINKHFEEGCYDTIIVDSAPTGETLRLLSLPDGISWWVSKFLPIHKKILKIVRPAARMVTDMPLPEDETYDTLEELFHQVYNLYYTLQNPDVSSVRIVTNPEKMVIKETEKAYTYLHLFGFPVDAIVVNKVVSEEDPLFEIQRKYIEYIKRCFEPTPIIMVSNRYEEVIGFDKLRKLGKMIYGERMPDEVLYKDKPFEITETNSSFILKILLKNPQKGKLEVYHKNEDLIIVIGNYKKHFYLPKALMNREVKRASLKDSTLEILFQ
jgi:arsenite-transporting ATPase